MATWLTRRLRSRKNRSLNELGQSILIDVLLASLLLGLLTVPALYLITTSTSHTYGAQFQTTAASIAKGIVQQYETLATTTTSTFPPMNGTASLTKTWAAYHLFDTKAPTGKQTRGLRDIGHRHYLVEVNGGWCAEKYTATKAIGSFLSKQRKTNVDKGDLQYFVGVKVYWRTTSATVVTKAAQTKTSSLVVLVNAPLSGNYTKTGGPTPTKSSHSTSTTTASTIATTTPKSPFNDCPLLSTTGVT